jgi:diguanylate cyclase (GGDEF)-like protein
MKGLGWWLGIGGGDDEPGHGPAREDASPSEAGGSRRSEPLRDLIVLSLFLHSAGTVEEMMSTLLERSHEVTGASFVLPLVADRRREVLHARPLAASDDPGLGRLAQVLDIDLEQFELPVALPSPRQAVLDGGEVALFDGLHELAEDVVGGEACDDARRKLDLSRVALVPMVVEGEPLGLLVFMFQQAEPDTELLELLAGHCALALRTLTALEEAARFGEIDQVTWVYGRNHFLRSLEDEVSRSRRYGHSLSLALLDIDGFAYFNRTYGATLGDRLLRSVAMLLAEAVSEPEVVARMGADEFAVLLPEADRARAVSVVREMVDRVSRVNVFAGSDAPEPVSVSVAIVCYPADAASADDLMARATAGLEEAKREGAAAVPRIGPADSGPPPSRGEDAAAGRSVA